MRPTPSSDQHTRRPPGPSDRVALAAWAALLVVLVPIFIVLADHPGWLLMVETQQPSRCLIRARELVDQGRYTDALSTLERGLRFYSEQMDKTGSARHLMTVAMIYHSMGLTLLKRGEPGDRERAADRFRRAVEVYPRIARGEANRLLGDFERQADPASALRRYAGVVAAVSDSEALRARSRSASILARLGRWQEAVAAFEDSFRFRTDEPDMETFTAFVTSAERIHSGTSSPLGRAYLRLGKKETAKAVFEQAAESGDPVAEWYLAEFFDATGYELDGIEFNPQLAFAAGAGISSVSFTWPAGCFVEFVADGQAPGSRLVVTLQPDRLRPEKVQLMVRLNGEEAGTIDVVQGGPADYETGGIVRRGRNVLEIRCGKTWFEPDDRPILTLWGLKAGSQPPT